MKQRFFYSQNINHAELIINLKKLDTVISDFMNFGFILELYVEKHSTKHVSILEYLLLEWSTSLT
jgi:hypothetical protein